MEREVIFTLDDAKAKKEVKAGAKRYPKTKRWMGGSLKYDSETLRYLMMKNADVICACGKSVYYGYTQTGKGGRIKDGNILVYAKCDERNRDVTKGCDYISVASVAKDWRSEYCSEFSPLRKGGSKSQLRVSGDKRKREEDDENED
jgi:hypothetical protein